jgi:hypothetical protein
MLSTVHTASQGEQHKAEEQRSDKGEDDLDALSD